MALLAYLPSSTRIGNHELADPVVHVPTLIGSSSGEGEISRRASVHPADINPNHTISNDALTSPAFSHRRTLGPAGERER